MMKRLRQTTAALAGIFFLVGFSTNGPGWVRGRGKKTKKEKADKPDKAEKKAKKNKDDAGQSPTVSDRELRNVMWTEPTNIESLDLFNGPGGADGAPDPQGKFTFEERVSSG